MNFLLLSVIQMKPTDNKFSFSFIFWCVGIFCAIVALISLLWITVIWQRQRARTRQLTDIQVTLALAQKNLYAKQNAGIFGGKTPAETIYLYYEFLEARFFPILSTYFVPEKRQAELTRFDGVSEEEILALVEELRAAEILARKADLQKNSYVITSPLKIKLLKMENGAWEFEYIKREPQ